MSVTQVKLLRLACCLWRVLKRFPSKRMTTLISVLLSVMQVLEIALKLTTG